MHVNRYLFCRIATIAFSQISARKVAASDEREERDEGLRMTCTHCGDYADQASLCEYFGIEDEGPQKA